MIVAAAEAANPIREDVNTISRQRLITRLTNCARTRTNHGYGAVRIGNKFGIGHFGNRGTRYFLWNGAFRQHNLWEVPGAGLNRESGMHNVARALPSQERTQEEKQDVGDPIESRRRGVFDQPNAGQIRCYRNRQEQQ